MRAVAKDRKDWSTHIQPDKEEATRAQNVVADRLNSVLARIAEGQPPPGLGKSGDPIYPGYFAIAHQFQVRPGANLGGSFAEAVEGAMRSRERGGANACPAWKLDLAHPEPYLIGCLDRAVAQVPIREDKPPASVSIGAATAQERSTFCAAACSVGAVWPEMLEEMRLTVSQLALVRGYGIDGFTDFNAHGAIFVNERRFLPDSIERPSEIHLAETLVHESTHNRCNAATLAEPLIHSPRGNEPTLVVTPLRKDLRPLMGLLQQIVVLVRCFLLHEKLLAYRPEVAGPTEARRLTLLEQAKRGIGTMLGHLDKLTPSGRDLMLEAEALIASRDGVVSTI